MSMHNILISSDLGIPFEEFKGRKDDMLSVVEELNEEFNIIIFRPDSASSANKSGHFIEDFLPAVMPSIQNAHIVHAGLQFIAENQFFEWTKPLVTNWHFLTPNPEKSNCSWKATSHFFFIRKGTLKKLEGFDRGFSTLDAAFAELAYRCMVCGGRVRYEPLPNQVLKKNLVKTSLEDDFRFITKHLGKKPMGLLVFYFLITFHVSSIFKFIRWKYTSECQPFNRTKILNYHLNDDLVANAKPYSAIIPTIDRYAYLDKAILSLLNNPIPPEEIIVVDQTPQEKRIENYYRQFPERVKVFFQEQPGQCTSRNLAIEKAQHEWLLLFEDDAEAWANMIEEHFKLIATTSADASTGVSLAPWKDVSYIPKRIAFYHNADVLSTGNCLVRKSALMAVGGLHPAYNRGSGADDDLGRRMYLNGFEIVFNPYAIMTHHKAPSGGMRVHGAWWRNTSKLMQGFPPATELYTIKTYYEKKFELLKVCGSYLNSFKRSNHFQYLALLVFFPIKFSKSKIAYKKILSNLKSDKE